jgi:hypothetical protein
MSAKVPKLNNPISQGAMPVELAFRCQDFIK